METGEITRAEDDARGRGRTRHCDRGTAGSRRTSRIVSLLLKESTDPEHRSEEALQTLEA